jgi:hypothetical protein
LVNAALLRLARIRLRLCSSLRERSQMNTLKSRTRLKMNRWFNSHALV